MREVYCNEETERIARELEAEGNDGLYLQQLRAGKPSITGLWRNSGDDVKSYIESKQTTQGIPDYTLEEETFLEETVIPELEKVAVEAYKTTDLLALRIVASGLATGSIRNGWIGLLILEDEERHLELKLIRKILKHNTELYSSIRKKVYDAVSERFERMRPWYGTGGTGHII